MSSIAEVIATLQASIDSLYIVFARYPLRERVYACKHCYPDAYAALAAPLYAKPLRELSANDLFQYNLEAISTWGDLSDWCHFLPRILELHCETRGIGDFGLTMTKLQAGQWLTWREADRSAVHDYLFGFWRYLLFAPFYEQNMHWKEVSWVFSGFLAGIAIALGDLSLLLQMWRDASDAQPLLMLVWFIRRFEQDLLHGQIEPQPYWTDKHTRHQLFDWLQAHETEQMLVKAAALQIDPESAQIALSILRKIPGG